MSKAEVRQCKAANLLLASRMVDGHPLGRLHAWPPSRINSESLHACRAGSCFLPLLPLPRLRDSRTEPRMDVRGASLQSEFSSLIIRACRPNRTALLLQTVLPTEGSIYQPEDYYTLFRSECVECLLPASPQSSCRPCGISRSRNATSMPNTLAWKRGLDSEGLESN